MNWILSFFRGEPVTGKYRIVRRISGFEPQCSYTSGMVKGVFWYPLNAAGYWLEPEAFNYGKITKHITMSKDEARRAVLRARAINEHHIKEA